MYNMNHHCKLFRLQSHRIIKSGIFTAKANVFFYNSPSACNRKARN